MKPVTIGAVERERERESYTLINKSAVVLGSKKIKNKIEIIKKKIVLEKVCRHVF